MKSQRVEFLKQSDIRRMTRECTRLGGINLGQGICDLPSPPVILEEASKAILADKSVYSKFEGIDALREALADKLSDYNGLTQVNPDTDIVVTAGATGAFIATRSEEHTSELQSRPHLVCRLLLEKKKYRSRSSIRVNTSGRAWAATSVSAAKDRLHKGPCCSSSVGGPQSPTTS